MRMMGMTMMTTMTRTPIQVRELLHMSMKTRMYCSPPCLLIITFGFILAAAALVEAQDQGSATGNIGKGCIFFDQAEQAKLIAVAEQNQFTIRRIEITGNATVRHREFTKRMPRNFNEGYVFTRKSLELTVKRLSRMKSIHPLSLANVELRIDRQSHDVDLIFCVTEKPKVKWSTIN
jgi:Surface antigen variable number repeat